MPRAKFKQREWTFKHKLAVIEHLERSGSMQDTIEAFFPDASETALPNLRRLIYRWRAPQHEIAAMCAKAATSLQKLQRNIGAATTLPLEVEETIVQWVNSLLRDGIPVSPRMLQDYALEAAKPLALPAGSFTASSSWRAAFMRRHKLTIRQRIRKGSIKPDDAAAIRDAFIQDMHELIATITPPPS
ncbi:TPA: hypothetical protein N0F65_005823 [Lagenidium giganteum]|uniref:HTH CENPB-type domain-containing protein n=1 Tax=Lagenidium giganteum TaxID=4803 RepID=A0AAV2YVN7_9STRA|nr:TPA: hypothetical protein N0F65_005823 [Lagenidium giganteum]